eukprot:snap_masked-scaffold394_size185225-processed-gene-0.4 protein:Tk12262 transcript:snap_masked-scaffold394_size185225-processed-gene-0.4-mRNA-1 annotation:"PREDICTED: putative uncharacterized protein FLJ37770"
MGEEGIYKIIAKVKTGEDTEDRRGKTSTRTPRPTCDKFEAVRAVVTSDRRVTVEILSSILDLSNASIHRIHQEDLGLGQTGDFFLFPKCKNELAGVTMKWEDVTTNLDGVCGTILIVDFVEAFHAWKRRWEKCIQIEGGYVAKS